MTYYSAAKMLNNSCILNIADNQTIWGDKKSIIWFKICNFEN